jgi:hypothetical protein
VTRTLLKINSKLYKALAVSSLLHGTEGCFTVTITDPIQPKQPRREFKNCSRNILNIHLTTQTWPAKIHLGGKRFADNKEVKMEVWKRLRQQPKDFHAAGFDALLKQCNNGITVGGGRVKK